MKRTAQCDRGTELIELYHRRTALLQGQEVLRDRIRRYANLQRSFQTNETDEIIDDGYFPEDFESSVTAFDTQERVITINKIEQIIRALEDWEEDLHRNLVDTQERIIEIEEGDEEEEEDEEEDEDENPPDKMPRTEGKGFKRSADDYLHRRRNELRQIIPQEETAYSELFDHYEAILNGAIQNGAVTNEHGTPIGVYEDTDTVTAFDTLDRVDYLRELQEELDNMGLINMRNRVDLREIEEEIRRRNENPPDKMPRTEGKGLSTPYKIQPYTLQQAKRLGVKVSPSKDPSKKISVYDKNGKHLCDIGDKNYGDFPTFKSEKGMEYALQRRKLYKQRHEKDRHIKGSKGWWADQLLW